MEYINDHVGDFAHLGQEIRRRRTLLGLSQQDVATLGGPSVSMVSGLENGKARKLSYGLAMRLEDVLGWSRGSVRAVLDGGVPTGPKESPRSDPVVQAIASDVHFSGDEKQALILMVRALRGNGH